MQTNKVHFPTALGLLILLVAIFLGVFFAKTRTVNTNQSQETATPSQIRITNVTDNGFSTSWLTDQQTEGFLKYGTKETELSQSTLDDRDQLSGEKGKFEVHYVTSKNLMPATKYYFKIDSGGKQFDNNGKPFEVVTGPTLTNAPSADPIYGTILTQSGTAAEGVIVYINVANAAPLSALTKTNGNWALSLATARTSDLSGFLKYDTQATIINLLVQAGKLGTASAITTATNDNPVPDISLGKSEDFRAQAMPSSSTTAGDAGATESGQIGQKSGFLLNPLVAQVATESGEVTLNNPAYDGEVINATQPAFMGSGPAGKILAIEIHSTQTYTGSATVNSSGEWEFNAPKGLTPGEHTVTINYIGTDGKEATISRNFVIAQAGETTVPAITATPSGGTTSPSPAPRTSMPATGSGIPHPGSSEISLLMLLTGLGLIIGSLKIKNIV
ncbi:MAG: Ig-like domain-containing protein [Candidatus Beckwithbacteria bacterium]|nr:Ig-like domain-containing protein [Candidatus Beckwithbacteria bacterium]